MFIILNNTRISFDIFYQVKSINTCYQTLMYFLQNFDEKMQLYHSQDVTLRFAKGRWRDFPLSRCPLYLTIVDGNENFLKML